jgi:hypothetical protein
MIEIRISDIDLMFKYKNKCYYFHNDYYYEVNDDKLSIFWDENKFKEITREAFYEAKNLSKKKKRNDTKIDITR